MIAEAPVREITASQVTQAWEAYVAKAHRLLDNNALLIDREFREDLARFEDDWKRLYLAWCAQ